MVIIDIPIYCLVQSESLNIYEYIYVNFLFLHKCYVKCFVKTKYVSKQNSLFYLSIKTKYFIKRKHYLLIYQNKIRNYLFILNSITSLCYKMDYSEVSNWWMNTCLKCSLTHMSSPQLHFEVPLSPVIAPKKARPADTGSDEVSDPRHVLCISLNCRLKVEMLI